MKPVPSSSRSSNMEANEPQCFEESMDTADNEKTPKSNPIGVQADLQCQQCSIHLRTQHNLERRIKRLKTRIVTLQKQKVRGINILPFLKEMCSM